MLVCDDGDSHCMARFESASNDRMGEMKAEAADAVDRS